MDVKGEVLLQLFNKSKLRNGTKTFLEKRLLCEFVNSEICLKNLWTSIGNVIILLAIPFLIMFSSKSEIFLKLQDTD